MSALGKIGDPKSAPAVVSFFSDESKSDWHHLAAIELGNIGSEIAAQALFSRLDNPGRISSHFLWESIAQQPQSLRIKELESLLTSGDESNLPIQAVHGLAQMGTSNSNNVLRAHLKKSNSTKVRQEIEKVLTEFSNE